MENTELNEVYETPVTEEGDGKIPVGTYIHAFGFDKIVIILVIISVIFNVWYLTNHITFEYFVSDDNILVEGDGSDLKITQPYDELIDLRKFYDKYANQKVPYSEFINYFDITVEGDPENITQGSEVTFVFKCDEKAVEKAIKKKLRKSVYKLEFKNDYSPDGKIYINPFHYLNFVCQGTEGNVTMNVTSDESQSNQYGYTLKLTKQPGSGLREVDVLEVYKGTEYINAYEIECDHDLSRGNSANLREGDAIEVTFKQKSTTNEIYIPHSHIIYVNPLDEAATSKQSINEESVQAFKAAAQKQAEGATYLHTYFLEGAKDGNILLATFMDEQDFLHYVYIVNPGIDANGNIQQYSLDAIDSYSICPQDSSELGINKEIKNEFVFPSSVEDSILE